RRMGVRGTGDDADRTGPGARTAGPVDQRSLVDLSVERVAIRIAWRDEDAVWIRAFGKHRTLDAEHGTGIDEDRRPQAQLAGARAQREDRKSGVEGKRVDSG